MHLCFLMSGSLKTLTGGYIYDRQLVNYLRKSGHRVDILKLPCVRYHSRILHGLRLAHSKQIESLAYDVLLEDELDHPALVLFNRLIKRNTACRIICIVHNLRTSERKSDWRVPFYRVVEKLFLKGVDGYIFNSCATRRAVENLSGERKPSIIANPGGDRIPTARNRKRNRKTGQRVQSAAYPISCQRIKK